MSQIGSLDKDTGIKVRRNRSISANLRHNVRPTLHTSVLIYSALQVAFLSFLFSYYGISTGDVLYPVISWTVENFQKISYIKSTCDFVQSLIDKAIGREENIQKTSEQEKDHLIEEKTDSEMISYLMETDVSLPVFTSEQLSFFDGTRPSKGINLAILGRIYNVQNGAKHYGPGGDYNFFAGRDATRAFVTGDFSESGLVDSVEGFGYQELLGVLDWIKFYEKEYAHVGYLQGTYYDGAGQPTSRLKEVTEAMQNAKMWKDTQAEEAKVFPPCNSEWRKESGGRVWCSKKSGGIERDWSGVPRKFFGPGSKSYRCACVKNFGQSLSSFSGMTESSGRGDLDNPSLKEYEGCSPNSITCKITET